jgi:hypothetical protein
MGGIGLLKATIWETNSGDKLTNREFLRGNEHDQ